jgi:hypothetical protein
MNAKKVVKIRMEGGEGRERDNRIEFLNEVKKELPAIQSYLDKQSA